MLTQISIRDFMIHGESIFLPDDDALILVMGENGVGKSALFEAVYWCLTGKTVRGMAAANVIRHGAKDCEVETSWQLAGGEMLVIQRYKSKSENRVDIYVGDDEEPESYTGTEGQDRIEELLGDLSLLSLVSFYGRKFTTFSSMSARDRADLIDVLARAGIWEDARAEAASDVSIYRRDAKGIREDLNTAEGNLQRNRDSLADAETSLAEATTAQKEGLAGHRKDEKRFRAQKAKLEKELALVEQRITLLDRRSKSDDATTQDYAQQITDKRVAIAAIESELRHYELPEENECPTCGQRISKKLRDEIGSEADEIAGKLPTLEKELESVHADHAKHIEAIGAVSDELRNKRGEEREIRRDITQTSESLSSVQRRIERLKNNEDVTRYGERVEILSGPEGVPMWEQRVKDRRDALTETEHALQCAEFWTTGFKQIRYMAMSRVADLLSTLMSRSVKALGFGVDELTCSIWKEGQRKGSTRPEVNILVRRGEYTDTIEALSEGQTSRVDLACFIAIGQLVRAIEGFDPGFRVFDEPLVGMDDGGKHKTFQLLADTLEGQRFVIDHDGNFQDLFNEAIEVVLDDEGLARIESL